MKKRTFQLIPVFLFVCLALLSCKKDLPTVDFTFEADGTTVTFTSVVTNADTYSWEFGDGSTSTEENPVHTYAEAGDFEVTLTAKNGDGEKSNTQTVSVTPSVMDMLTGGPTDTNGKTWVLSHEYNVGIDGGSVINDAMWVMLPIYENVLTRIGLNEEYDNEYTFRHDGTYSINLKNGQALTAGIFGMLNGTVTNPGNELNDLGLCASTYTPPASSTFTLHTENLVIEAITNPLGNSVPAPKGNQTITGKSWVSFSEGAFFGILDFPTTRKVIIKQITPNKMHVALFVCGYFADQNAWTVPTFLYHVTFIPKP